MGYALNLSGDTYQMWDPITSQVHETQDVIWLHRMFYPAPILAQDIAVVDKDVIITIPQQEAGESLEPGVNNPTGN